MQALLQSIRDHYEALPQAQKTVANFVAEHYRKIPFYTVAALAEEIGVSDTSIIKFCMAIGYDGYGSLKRTLAEQAQADITLYGRLESGLSELHGDDTLERTAAAETANIQAVLTHPMNRGQFKTLVDRVLAARTIFVGGFRTSAVPADYLLWGLEQQGLATVAITPGSGDIPDRLCRLGPEDLLVVFSFIRCARESVAAVETARAAGAFTVAVTDLPLSPLAQLADLTFHCPAGSLNYVPSFSGAMTLIHALLTATSATRVDAVKDSLQRLEKVLSRFDTYHKA